jgi:hypothetical protein
MKRPMFHRLIAVASASLGTFGCTPSQPLGLSTRFESNIGPITVWRLGFRGTVGGAILVCDYRAIYENTTNAPQQPQGIVTLQTADGNSLAQGTMLMPLTMPGRSGLAAIMVVQAGCQHAQKLHLQLTSQH